MPTTNATECRKNFFETLKQVVEFNEPVTITTKNGNAVLISEDDYNAMMETIYLASKPGLVEKIKEGDKEDPEKMTKYDPDEEW